MPGIRGRASQFHAGMAEQGTAEGPVPEEVEGLLTADKVVPAEFVKHPAGRARLIVGCCLRPGVGRILHPRARSTKS